MEMQGAFWGKANNFATKFEIGGGDLSLNQILSTHTSIAIIEFRTLENTDSNGCKSRETRNGWRNIKKIGFDK